MTYEEYLVNKRPYQEDGHIFLLERKHACLFYKPGKGKTYPCIDAMRDVDREKKGNAKVLILSTADAITSMWRSEIEPQKILPDDTVLMSFTSAIQDKTRVKLIKVKWDIIVIDECHKIKSHNSKISKLVFQLAKNCEYVWGLSGTPRGNSDVDIFCQFHNMHIADWGSVSYTDFINYCCDLDVQFFGDRVIKKPIGINHRYKAGWERNISMYTQRVDYTEEDEMPDLDVNLVKIPYEVTEEYKKAELGVVQIPNYETTMTKLAAISKLHQIANGYMYYTEFDDDGNEKRKVHKISKNNKLDWLKNEIRLEPVVIVYRFEQDLNDLKQEFEDTTENIDDFKTGKNNILLLQCSRCESFNLQMCKHIIFYTLDYSYIKYNQMLHRVWRMGQKRDVTIDVLVSKNTIEEKIWNTVKQKETLADLFMSIKGV